MARFCRPRKTRNSKSSLLWSNKLRTMWRTVIGAFQAACTASRRHLSRLRIAMAVRKTAAGRKPQFPDTAIQINQNAWVTSGTYQDLQLLLPMTQYPYTVISDMPQGI